MQDKIDTEHQAGRYGTFEAKSPNIVNDILNPQLGIANSLESLLCVKLSKGDGNVVASGDDCDIAVDILRTMEGKISDGYIPNASEIMAHVSNYRPSPSPKPPAKQEHRISTRKNTVFPKSDGQSRYVGNMNEKDLTFGLGPAGSGKTFLAIGTAVEQIEAGNFDKIILTRPAVEAGEKLGYLPGDMKDKVDPYMQPLYDALGEFMAAKAVAKMLESKVIEISPIAFMRGRTLKNAFVILDEAQNTTTMQMKMFLTRMGAGSRMVVVGDPKQSDLPKGVQSGLVDAVDTLKNVSDIGFSYLSAADIVRHPLVAKIVKAYDEN